MARRYRRKGSKRRMKSSRSIIVVRKGSSRRIGRRKSRGGYKGSRSYLGVRRMGSIN